MAIIGQQKPEGNWDGEYNANISIPYALLFLSRGRNPIVFNKLQYDGPWNVRPRDNAYTEWSESLARNVVLFSQIQNNPPAPTTPPAATTAPAEATTKAAAK